jgi:cytochrome c556
MMGDTAVLGRLAAVCMLVGLSIVASADEQDVIDYRQHVMTTLQEQTASIAMILQKKAPAENLGAHAKLLSLAAVTAKKTFDTKAPGGNAKPEVWSNAADFAKRMDALVAAADDQVKATGNAQTASAKNQAVLAACKGCHDAYMTPKK